MTRNTKTIIRIVILMLATLPFVNEIKAATVHIASRDTTFNVIPDTGTNPNKGNPRTPELVPITASYSGLVSSVIIAFRYDLGEIEAEVLNASNGGYVFGTIDTQSLCAMIPITSGAGHYILTFTLPSGKRYKGEFDL